MIVQASVCMEALDHSVGMFPLLLCNFLASLEEIAPLIISPLKSHNLALS